MFRWTKNKIHFSVCLLIENNHNRSVAIEFAWKIPFQDARAFPQGRGSRRTVKPWPRGKTPCTVYPLSSVWSINKSIFFRLPKLLLNPATFLKCCVEVRACSRCHAEGRESGQLRSVTREPGLKLASRAEERKGPRGGGGPFPYTHNIIQFSGGCDILSVSVLEGG